MFRYIISGLLFFGLQAQAETKVASSSGGHSAGASEFFYQTEAGKQDITPSLELNSTTVKLKGGTNLDVNLNVLGVEYERGITDQLSVGGYWAYIFSGEASSGSVENDISGLTNMKGFVKGTMPLTVGALKFGTELLLSLWDAEIDSSGDQNGVTGGHSLTPYFGYETSMKGHIFGARLKTEIGLGDRTLKDKEAGTTSSISGDEPTTLSFFYESQITGTVRFGAAFDWITYSEREKKTGGSTVKSEDLTPQQLLTVYLPVAIGPGTLLPKLQYGFSTDDDVKSSGTNIDVDTYRVLNLVVAYRMPF